MWMMNEFKMDCVHFSYAKWNTSVTKKQSSIFKPTFTPNVKLTRVAFVNIL